MCNKGTFDFWLYRDLFIFSIISLIADKLKVGQEMLPYCASVAQYAEWK